MKMYFWVVIAAACLCVSLGAGARAGDDAPVSIALIDFDYVDTSGEVPDQTAEHRARLKMFLSAFREDLAKSGRYRVVSVTCDPAPCSITDTDPGELFAAAQRAGAKLLLFGGIHKMSTLVQFGKVQVVDVEQNKVVFRRSLSFRGDDDRSWLHAERFLVKELDEGLPN